VYKKNLRYKKEKVVDSSIIMNIKIDELATAQTDKTEIDEEY
jgi:hypothetical protein